MLFCYTDARTFDRSRARPRAASAQASSTAVVLRGLGSAQGYFGLADALYHTAVCCMRGDIVELHREVRDDLNSVTASDQGPPLRTAGEWSRWFGGLAGLRVWREHVVLRP